MTTPTTMTTSMMTTATTMMTDVVVSPSLEGLFVGCVLQLTGTAVAVVVASQLGGTGCMLLLAWTVPVLVIVPTFEEGVVLAVVDTVER